MLMIATRKNKKSDIMSLFSLSFTAVQAGNDFC